MFFFNYLNFLKLILNKRLQEENKKLAEIEAKNSNDSDLVNQKAQMISQKEAEIKKLQDKLMVTLI
jgi:hypothetical protein